MRVLAIETSTMLGGVAVMGSAEGLLYEMRMSVRGAHSERLLLAAAGALESTGTDVRSLGAVAVSIGPGGFTGLRVGLSTAKGLAFSAGVRLVGVPTLRAMALSMPHSAWPVCPMLDARKGQVYAGLYIPEKHGIESAIADRAVKAREMAGLILEYLDGRGRVLFMGQGAELYRSDMEAVLGPAALFVPGHLGHPSASSVAALAIGMIDAGYDEDPRSVNPVYLRKSEAEVRYPHGMPGR